MDIAIAFALLLLPTPTVQPQARREAGADAHRFQAQCAKLAADATAAGRETVVGRSGWLFFGPELRFLGVGRFWGAAARSVSHATDPRYADPLPAIVDFARQLRRAGVQLLVLPVPPKAVIYPDELPGWMRSAKSPRRLDQDLQAFYGVLRKEGVEVLDLTPEFLADRQGPRGAVFCKQDTHWSGAACVLVAKRIAALVRQRAWVKSAPKRKYAARWEKVQIAGDLRDDAGQALPSPESVWLRSVMQAVGGQLVETSRSSPILLMGDSYTLVFHSGGDMLAAGAGLADQVAYELGLPVDLIGVRGSGATPARISLMRQARSHPGYLKQKKLVIWCFGAREFTESSGWQKVPVVP